jgi:hypothetical protein
VISPFNFSTPGTYLLSLTMFHERLFPRADRLEIWVSTNGSSSSRLGIGPAHSLSRYDWSLSSNAPVWQEHLIDLSAYSARTSYLVTLFSR